MCIVHTVYRYEFQQQPGLVTFETVDNACYIKINAAPWQCNSTECEKVIKALCTKLMRVQLYMYTCMMVVYMYM